MPSTKTPIESKAKSAKNSGAKKKARKKARKKAPVPMAGLTAKTADKHQLYQHSVQSAKEDVRFMTRVYKSARGKMPLHFREDFCGTALLSAAWVQRGKQYSAEGFDICTDTLAWGKEHNLDPMGEDAKRICLHPKDVREKSTKKPDLRAAQNFSYFIFRERTEMKDYFKGVLKDLAKDGVFVMDIYGGPDAMKEMEEEREVEEGFTYVWDQDEYWPATGEYRAYIHFRFEDGSEMNRAFTYHWRLWNLTEIVDLLQEVGFANVDTYWEGTDKDGTSGNGVYRKSKRGENCDAWVTYIVASK